MNQKTIVFAVGGTGGHLFPAVALSKRIKELEPSLSLHFAGGGVKSRQWLEAERIPYTQIPSAPLSVKRPLQSLQNLLTIRKGVQESKKLLLQLMPPLVIGFGSFYSLPLLVAARSLKIPYVLHEQNAVPGRVVRLFSRGALFTAVHFEASISYLKGECQIFDMPLRWKLPNGNAGNARAKEHFGLQGKSPVVLIFGGSQGASRINRWLMEGVGKRGNLPVEILHFTGNPSDTEKLTALYRDAGIAACVKDFEERMDLAWQAADLAVTRAGAVSVAEEIEFEVPGILIPYPLAMDNHQEVNADFFATVVKGGVKYLEGAGSGSGLLDAMLQMINRGELERFRNNISDYKKASRPKEMAGAVLELLRDSPLLVDK